MQYDPSTEVLFIPDDIAAAFQDEAIVQVSASWSQRPETIPARRGQQVAVTKKAGTSSLERALVAVAMTIALIGTAVCTGWWAWLAHTTGSATWASFAFGGGVALALGLVASVVLVLKR